MCIDTFTNYFLVWKSVIEIFEQHREMCGVCGYPFFKFKKSPVKNCAGFVYYTLLLTQDISEAIASSKLKYYEGLVNKLNDPKAAPKPIGKY